MSPRNRHLHAHHHTSLSGSIFATTACIDSRKNLLNINISSTCPHNTVISGLLAAEIGSGTPANFNAFRLPSYHLYCSDVADQRTTKLCMIFGRLLQLIRYIGLHFRGKCLLPELCQVQNSLYVQTLRSRIRQELIRR